MDKLVTFRCRNEIGAYYTKRMRICSEYNQLSTKYIKCDICGRHLIVKDISYPFAICSNCKIIYEEDKEHEQRSSYEGIR